MTTYNRPGVFTQETLQPLAAPAHSSSDAIAAFVGESSKGGPLGPALVTSWSQYKALYGDIERTSDDLGYGVFTFFNNGGSQAYIVRAANKDATPASVSLDDDGGASTEATTPQPVLDVTAQSPGTWADATVNPDSGIYVTVTTEANGRFNLIVEVGTGQTLTAREQFVDLTLDPNDSRNALSLVNSDTVGSKYVTLSLNTGVSAETFGTDYSNPTDVSETPLAGGSEGTGTPDLFGATQTLTQVDANLMLNLPGVSDTTVLSDVIDWAETQTNVFVVVDGPRPAPGDDAVAIATALEGLATGLPTSSYAAVYGPYLYIADPASRVSGALRLTAPGGSVLGQYAYNDTSRGVQKDPAGIHTALRGVQDMAARFDSATLDALNEAHVNVIRTVPGRGFCIMGGRTLDVGMPDRYINIRRSLMFLKRDLVNLTRFAIFEVNDADTWEQISAVLDQYLLAQFQAGLLSGDTPDQAFYITCDDTNNDTASVNAGIVNVEIGVALNSPAEFIIIRIGQFDGGSTVTES